MRQIRVIVLGLGYLFFDAELIGAERLFPFAFQLIKRCFELLTLPAASLKNSSDRLMQIRHIFLDKLQVFVDSLVGHSDIGTGCVLFLLQKNFELFRCLAVFMLGNLELLAQYRIFDAKLLVLFVRNNPFAALVQNDRLNLTRARSGAAHRDIERAGLLFFQGFVFYRLFAENFSEMVWVILQHLDLFRRKGCNLFIRKLIDFHCRVLQLLDPVSGPPAS